jgi:hypothetical protein
LVACGWSIFMALLMGLLLLFAPLPRSPMNWGVMNITAMAAKTIAAMMPALLLLPLPRF